MEFNSINSAFDEIIAYFSGEKTGHVLIVNTDNQDIYIDLLERITADKTKTIKYTSDFCPSSGLPDLDAARLSIRGEGSYALIGISQASFFKGKKYTCTIIGSLLDMSIKGYTIVILYKCSLYLSGYIKNNLKNDRKIVLINGEPSSLPFIYISETEEKCISKHALNDTKRLFSVLEKMEKSFIDTGIINVISSLPISLFKDSLYNIYIMNSFYEIIKSAFPEISSSIQENWGTNEEWQYLLSIVKNQGFSDSIRNKLKFSDNYIKRVKSIITGSNPLEKWLLFIFLKLYGIGSNEYLNYAAVRANNADKLEYSIYMSLLDISVSDQNFSSFYTERKELLESFPENHQLINTYCISTGVYEKNAVWYLTDKTSAERYELLRCFNIYDYTVQEILNITEHNFNDLFLYMQEFDFNQYNMALPENDNNLRRDIGNYFNQYKLQKITNRINPAFIDIVKEYSEKRYYNKLPSRSSEVRKLSSEGDALFFFDALGVEFLSYIKEKCRNYGLLAEFYISRSNLPTITIKNKEFLKYFNENLSFSIYDIDKIKHDGETFDYRKCELPIHIFSELKIIDKELNNIHSMLKNNKFKKIIIASDHGASRLAVISKEENQSPICLEEKGKHSGRCCPSSENPEIPFAAYENGFSVLADYSRFKGGRSANVEVHGGASLEEVLVPVIVVTCIPEVIDVRFIDNKNKFTIGINGAPILRLFSNLPTSNPLLKIKGKFYSGAFEGDNHHIQFILNDINRKGEYEADFFDGGSEIIKGLKFSIKKRLAEDNINFDDIS